MKRIYTLIFALLITTMGMSQSFFAVDSILSISSADVNATDLASKTYLINNSGQTLDVTYTFNGGVAITTDWEVGFCTNTACDDPSIITSGTFVMNDGDSVEVKITLLPMGFSDDLTGAVSFSAAGSALDRVTINYDLKVGTVGIKTIDTKSLSIFPNPATNFIQVKGIENINDVKHMEVYSIIGKKILNKEVSSTADLKVDIQNYEHGVYLVKLFDNTQNVFYTRTFVKK